AGPTRPAGPAGAADHDATDNGGVTRADMTTSMTAPTAPAAPGAPGAPAAPDAGAPGAPAAGTGRLRPRRSCLAVPGSNPRFLEKTQGLPADQVFLDLEDACAPLGKERARPAIVAAPHGAARGR